MKTKLKTNKGITLIALVITIIVLLILAGVSIAMLTGENGLLTKASESKQATERAGAKEAVQMEVAGSFTNDGIYSKDLAKVNIEKNLNSPQASVTDNGDGSLDVTYKGVELTVKSNGEVIYKVILDKTTYTTPYLPAGATVTNNDLDTGLTIKDERGNEWVWIEVPKSIYDNGANKPSSSTDYENIEAVMHEYTKTYRNGTTYTDTWSSNKQHGLTEPQYYELKNKMLESVYKNGGFYIGKYEAGIMEPEKNRTSYNTPIEETPVIKEGAYPYNYVTNKQAQELANRLSTGGKTSSLMFGVQWDLVLKHIETKGGKTVPELNQNSSSWGNHRDATFNIKKGKYSENGKNFTPVSGNYSKNVNTMVLLTTGATERNSTLNIYDLAGNVSEWTLEYTSITYSPCAYRGGYCNNFGSNYPSSTRSNTGTADSYSGVGFRPALY